MAAIFFQNYPLGSCLIPRFMGVYDEKDEETKYARVFMQKMQMLMQESNENGRNSNMQWSKLNMVDHCMFEFLAFSFDSCLSIASFAKKTLHVLIPHLLHHKPS